MNDIGKPLPFHCPSCGARLPEPDKPTVECSYCGSSVIVPKELLPEPTLKIGMPPPINHAIRIDLRPDALDPGIHLPDSRQSRRSTSIILVVVVLIVATGVLAGLGGLFTVIFSVRELSRQVDNAATVVEISPILGPPPGVRKLPTATFVPTPEPYASIVLEFGKEGSAPGQFNDPRELAVDLDGNIYVADYSTGRVQKFNSDGKFSWLLQVEPKFGDTAIITDLTVDTSGNLYVVSGGDILIYRSADGSPAGSIPGDFPEIIFERAAVDSTGNLFAVHESASGSDLLQLDKKGQPSWRIKDAVNSISKTPASIEALVVDGLGCIYLLDRITAKIYKFNSQGDFTDQIASAGDAPDQLRSPLALAVDGQDRLFVVDFAVIQVYSGNGAHLASIPWSGNGAGFDIAADNQGGIYIVSNLDKVVKFILSGE